MKIKIFYIDIIIIICLISFIKTELVIIGPNELNSRFNNQPIEIVFGKMSDISNFYVQGEIFFENKTILHEACSEIGTLLKRTNQNEFSENFKILLAYYGNCTFVQKARNAQNAGASMLLLINNNDQDIKTVLLEDDGSGRDIKIPVGLISLTDGKKIQNYIENNPKSKVMVEINFQKKITSEKKIDFKLFFSSSELKGYELINNITKYLDKFNEQINFIPIYVTHQSPTYDQKNSIRELNCVSKGKYCYFPKETTIIQDGQRILIESLRQKCMFSKNKEKLKYYYEYLNKFYTNCLIVKVPKFNDRCAKQTLDNMGYPVDYLDDCVAESFGVNSLLSSTYIDNENTIFKNDYDEILKYKLTSFPAVIIDDKPLNGIINEYKIIVSLCNAVISKPLFCAFMTGEIDEHISRMKSKKRWIFFLILVIICINIFLFFKCRKYILKQINEKIGYKIDLEGRINNIVQNYISLKNQGDDNYTSFDTASSKKNKDSNNPIEGTVNTI